MAKHSNVYINWNVGILLNYMKKVARCGFSPLSWVCGNTIREEQAHRVFTGDEFNRVASRVLKNNATGDIFKAKADLLQAKFIREAPRVEGSFQLNRRVSRFLNEMAEKESIGLSGNIRIEVEQLSSLIAQFYGKTTL